MNTNKGKGRGKKMVKVNAMGDACPIPVVKTKNAIKQLQQPGDILIYEDEEDNDE